MEKQSTLLDERQLAELLNVPVRTLQAQRQRGTGIPFVKIGRLVRYEASNVSEYLKGHLRASTSDKSE